MLIYMSKADSDVKILFGKITHLFRLRNYKNAGKGFSMGTRIPRSILGHVLLAIDF